MATVVTSENLEQCRAAYGDDYLIDHGCARIVLCDACGSEGRIYRGLYDDERDCGECPACDGTGEVVVAVDQVTTDDLDELEAEELRYGKLPPTG